jgi:hypothetical protein
MKLYFCDGCGKRLTDADLESGAARDKKLKGIYCQACSAKVTTAEFSALTDDKIQEIRTTLDAAPKARANGPQQTPPARHPVRTGRASTPKSIPVIAFVAPGVVLIGVIAMVMLSGGSGAPKSIAKPGSAAPAVAAPKPPPIEEHVKSSAEEPRVTVAAQADPGAVRSASELAEPESSARTAENLSRDLIGYWKLDETSGTMAKDSSPGGNSGTVRGPTWARGKFGGGLAFPGGTETMTVPDIGARVTDNFTMAFWADPNAARAVTPEACSGTSGLLSQRYAIFPTQAEIAKYPADHAGAGVSVGTNGIGVFEHTAMYLPSLLTYDKEISGWTHIAVVYVNKQPRLYVNGTLAKVGLKSTKTVHPSANLGAPRCGGFSGTLDEVRIYSRALTDAEVLELATYKPASAVVGEKKGP